MGIFLTLFKTMFLNSVFWHMLEFVFGHIDCSSNYVSRFLPLLLSSSHSSLFLSPPPMLAGMTCPMLNPLQTCPQPDSLINNLPELPILTNQGSCFSKPSKIERAQLPDIEGYVLTDLGWWSRPRTRSLGRASGGLASTALGRGRRRRRCWIWMPD